MYLCVGNNKKSKNMKVKFNRWYNVVLAAVLSLLGYGCGDDSDVPVMYGSPEIPYCDVEISGTVTDEENNPVEGIKTYLKEVYKYSNNETRAYGITAGATDESGTYTMNGVVYGLTDNVKLLVEDTDGAENGGEFENDTIDIDFSAAEKIDGEESSLYEGKYVVNMDVVLKKK